MDISSEIIRMRGELREYYDKTIEEEQRLAIEDEDSKIRARLDELEVNWKNKDIQLAHQLLDIYHKEFNDLKKYADEDNQMNGQEKLDYNSLSNINPVNDVMAPHGQYLENNVISSIHDAAQNVNNLMTSFTQRKRKKASENLNIELNKMIEDAESYGERIWSREVAKVVSAWEPGGKLRLAYEEENKMLLVEEEEMVKQYVRDQKNIATSLAINELQVKIRRRLSQLSKEIDRQHQLLLKESLSNTILINRCSDQLERNANLNEVELSTSLTAFSKKYNDRLVYAANKLRLVSQENAHLSVTVAILRQLSDKPPHESEYV